MLLLDEFNRKVSGEVRSDLLNYVIDYNIYRLNSERSTSSRELFYIIDLKINRNPGISLSAAYIAYYKNDFETCNKFLDNINDYNEYSYIDKAKLKMRSCFELGKFEESFDIKRRLLEYLRVKKNITEQYVVTAKEFCTLFNLLLKLKEYPSMGNFIKLEYELCKGSLSGKMWIVRKMKEIKLK